MPRTAAGQRVEERARWVSAQLTEQIARRLGGHFEMTIGCGFPRSGTVWLCHLLSSYLGVPFPQNFAAPIAMRAVVHAHWAYHPGLPRTAYILRDGRDVMVSLYHYQMRQLIQGKRPRAARLVAERYRPILGPRFDPHDVTAHLPRFIEAELRAPTFGRATWPQHTRDWLADGHRNVHLVRYEDLQRDPAGAFHDLMTSLTGEPADPRLVELAVRRHDFALTSGRSRGSEDRGGHQRKGVVGDWREAFDREAAEAFAAGAGDELVRLGYEPDDGWIRSLG